MIARLPTRYQVEKKPQAPPKSYRCNIVEATQETGVVPRKKTRRENDLKLVLYEQEEKEEEAHNNHVARS